MLEKGTSRQLTDNLRAEQPAATRGGGKIVFIQNEAGMNRLALLTPTEDKPATHAQVLFTSGFQQRLSNPEFLNENEILFVLRNRSGQERLYVYNLKSSKARLWSNELNSAQNPRVTEAGVLVSDDGTHVRNFYLLNGKAKPVTNTLTEIVTADYDPQRKELLVSELGGDGPKLRSPASRGDDAGKDYAAHF